MTRTPRGQGAEAEKIRRRLEGWNIDVSPATKSINEQFRIGMTHSLLKAIAEIICEKTGLHLDRDASRDNRVLVKWMDENWATVSLELPKITFCDRELVPIP